jgi:beta-lactamase class A
MRKSFLLFLATCSFLYARAQQNDLRQNDLRHQVNALLRTKQAVTGVAIFRFDTHDTLSVNGYGHFPMQSVFKFHIALAVLKEVEKRNLSLTQKVFISKDDFFPDTWSPIMKQHPDGNIELSLEEILRSTVSLSDNVGCDILLRMIGGPKVVNRYIASLGVSGVSIEATEKEMHEGWDVQFKNWSTPVAAVDLLRLFYKGEILSKENTAFLLKIMNESPTGRQRIKGQLPPETIVAHKTGTSGRSDGGIVAAVNDIGIVLTPDGKHFAISVFVSNSKETDEVNEKIIADVARLAWDYFSKTD